MKQSGVRTIVDLRNADEIGRACGDPQIDDSELLEIVRFHRPIEDQSHDEFMVRFGRLLSHPSYYPATFEYFPDMLRSAFETIAAADQAVLFHCSAGKDRTGLIAAVILSVNDVVIDDVLNDYELGVRGYAAWRHAHPDQGRERLLSDDELDLAIDNRREALRHWLAGTNLVQLLTQQLGLEAGIVRRLRRLLRPQAAAR